MSCERDLLEAIVDYPGLDRRDFKSVTGWGSFGQALASLNSQKLVTTYARYGTHEATERGKILMAIIRGKEMRARCSLLAFSDRADTTMSNTLNA